jgi:small subunit ribosomal protein S14
MAKESLIQKHKKKAAAWERWMAEERAILELPKDKQVEALAAFKARRVKARMFKSQRPHGYSRFFGVCRQVFREKAHRGELPGVKKSSW